MSALDVLIEHLVPVCFAALCWLHGYSQGRMSRTAQRRSEAQSAAYLRGRRDERADQEKERLL